MHQIMTLLLFFHLRPIFPKSVVFHSTEIHLALKANTDVLNTAGYSLNILIETPLSP